MQKAVAAALFMLLLFYGCVEERQISISGYEQIDSISGKDINGDGANDLVYYTFGEKSIDDAAGITMRKTVSVHPLSINVRMANYSNVNAFDLQYIKGKVAQFRQLKNEGEYECLSKLNLERAACTSEDTCLATCKSATCSKSAAYGEETFGYELYMFNSNAQELDQYIREIDALSSVSTAEEKDALAEKLALMMGLTGKLSSNLLFRYDAYGICNPPNYDGNLLADALSRLGKAELETGTYGYEVAILIESRGSEEFIELYLTDTPPLLLNMDEFSLDILENGKLEEKEPLTVGWDAIAVDGPHKILYYDFASSTEPAEEILTKWKFAKIKERNLKGLAYINEIYEHPVGNFVFSVAGTVFESTRFMGYYAAVGAAVSVWVIVMFLALLMLETIYFLLRAVMDRKNIRESMVESFGAPMADWKTYTAAGLLLMGASVIINLFYTSPVEHPGFGIEELISTLASDFAGAGCVVFFVIGAYTIFLVVEDWLKGIMLGKEYYELKGATKEENIRDLGRLRESWQALRMRVEDLSKTGMVVTEEYAVIVSVPIERLEQMIASGKQGMARQLIRFNQERLEGLEKRLDEKVNVMNQKWPEWKTELAKALSSSDQVPLNTLLFVPLQWREWAVEKYISENRTKGYVLEGDIVFRREVKVDDLLSKKIKDMIGAGIAKEALLLSQDTELFNSFEKGKKTLTEVLFLKLKSYVIALSKKMGAREVRRFVVSGAKGGAVYLSYNKYHAFIFAERSKIRNVVDEWAQITERLA